MPNSLAAGIRFMPCFRSRLHSLLTSGQANIFESIDKKLSLLN
jgi:hypothetical protein